jgi:aminopeptidase N
MISWPRKYSNVKYFLILIFRRLATSHFEPTYARRAFPCFDEPHLKAKFLMTITHDRNLVAFFNTPKKGVSSEVRGRPTQVKSSIVKLQNNPMEITMQLNILLINQFHLDSGRV